MRRSVVFRSKSFLLLLSSGAMIAGFTKMHFSQRLSQHIELTPASIYAPPLPRRHTRLASTNEHSKLAIPAIAYENYEEILDALPSNTAVVRLEKIPKEIEHAESQLLIAKENRRRDGIDHHRKLQVQKNAQQKRERETSYLPQDFMLTTNFTNTFIVESAQSFGDQRAPIAPETKPHIPRNADVDITHQNEQKMKFADASDSPGQPVSKFEERIQPSQSSSKMVAISKQQTKPKEIDAPKDMILPPWHSYKIKNTSSTYLRFLLMQLSRSNAPREEIPYRIALIESLLSDTYQMRVNAEWDEEEEDKKIKLLRREFVFDYLRRIKWESTKYERLFLADNEDLHQVDLDAFDDAMNIPLRIGIVRQEDLDCDTVVDNDEFAPKILE